MNSISTVLQGYQLALLPNVQAFWLENPRFGPQSVPPDKNHLCALYFDTPEQPKRRRHSRKGQASGCIKERIGNKKRKNPSISYFYEWYEDGRKQQRYVQVRLMSQTQQMIDNRRPCAEIIAFLNAQSRSTGKLHHTQEPKV